MSNPELKRYFSYYEMIVDFGKLTQNLDVDRTLTQAPPMSFYTTDGRIALGGNFIHFMQRLVEETGLKVLPFSCEEHVGYFLVSFSDFSPAEYAEEDKLEVQAVDSPAKKRSLRKK